MKKRINKIAISNDFLQANNLNRKNHLIRGIVFSAIAIVFVIVSRLFHPPTIVRLLISILAGVSILISSYNIIMFVVLKTKTLFYTNAIEQLTIADIHKSLISLGKVLLRQNDKTIFS